MGTSTKTTISETKQAMLYLDSKSKKHIVDWQMAEIMGDAAYLYGNEAFNSWEPEKQKIYVLHEMYLRGARDYAKAITTPATYQAVIHDAQQQGQLTHNVLDKEKALFYLRLQH